jgi:hypothetical protein
MAKSVSYVFEILCGVLHAWNDKYLVTAELNTYKYSKFTVLEKYDR